MVNTSHPPTSLGVGVSKPVRAHPAAATVSVASSIERRHSFHASEKVSVYLKDKSGKSMRLLCGWRTHQSGPSVKHFDINVSATDTPLGSCQPLPSKMTLLSGLQEPRVQSTRRHDGVFAFSPILSASGPEPISGRKRWISSPPPGSEKRLILAEMFSVSGAATAFSSTGRTSPSSMALANFAHQQLAIALSPMLLHAQW